MSFSVQDILNLPEVAAIRQYNTERLLIIFLKSNSISYYVYADGNERQVNLPSSEEIIKLCTKFNAKNVILLHNHPGRKMFNDIPSISDIGYFVKFKKELELYDIKLLDSIIVTQNSYVSFKELSHLL